jgi:general secretion pathway protein A
MYLAHYNLRLKPFEDSSDTRFFWTGERQKEALGCFKNGIQENKAFFLLTGDIGTGKTSLINYLSRDNDIDAVVATMVDPDLSIRDFFQMISQEFNFKIDFSTKRDFLNQFKRFLLNRYAEEKKALLIIDEAQKLNQQLIEQIRLLSKIEKKGDTLINIFFVGQERSNELIRNVKNQKLLREKVAVHYNIKPLTKHETREYINHRLKVAGSKSGIFSHEAIHEIFSFSSGYPRLINIICDRALLTGYLAKTKKITGAIVKQCADELKILVE